MTFWLIVFVGAIGVPLIYLATLDGHFSVRRSIEIPLPRKTVADRVRNLRSWPSWSPWLMHEPDAALKYSETPDQPEGWYEWDGKIVGAGRITQLSMSEDSIDQRIDFTRPFKSTSKVWWEFEKKDDTTTIVHWNMAGCMPFLFRPMAKKVPQFIAKDYDTGLNMLRGELVDDIEPPRFRFDGETELPAVTMLSLPFEGGLDEMKQAMEEGFPRLAAYLQQQGIQPQGPSFTLYTDVDPQAMHFVCDMAFPVPAGTRSDEFEAHEFLGGKFYKVTLHGSYEYLELAWYQAYSHLQMLKIKPRNRYPSLEVYENTPQDVADPSELITSIYIPVR